MISRRRIDDFVEGFELRSTGKWFVLSSLIGTVAGLGAIVFQKLTHLIVTWTLAYFAHYVPPEAAGEAGHPPMDPADMSPWVIVAMMTVGGLVSGILVYTFAPEAEGHGTDAAIDAFHNKRGKIRWHVPIIKTLASAATLGTGGSGGREGPIAQIGAGFGSWLATRLQLSARDRRIMLAAGMGAGVGAIFRAPLAGALFAGEILYKDGDIESDVIIPGAIASIIGYSVFSLSLPVDKRYLPLFSENSAHLTTAGTVFELVPLALLAVILVLVGILYITVFYRTHKLFKKVPVPQHVRPAIGAALAGLAALAIYFGYGQDQNMLGVLSTGYGVLQKALSATTELAPRVLIVIALVKIVTTSLTISSGGSGGVFGPSMVIGGCTGAAVGQVFAEWFPAEWVSSPEVYAIVGMAGFFAGCAHAPFSTIIMVSEMAGSYNLLLPTMWVSTLSFLLCRRWTLYIRQVDSRLDSPAHRGDFLVDLLEGIRVEDVYQKDRQLRYVHESMSLHDIVHLLAESEQQYFPVVNDAQQFIGIFSAHDVRAYLYDETIWNLANARDVMETNIVSVTPEDDLNTAMQRFTSLNVDELPVLDSEDPNRILGMLRRKETIAAYNRRMMEFKQQVREQN